MICCVAVFDIGTSSLKGALISEEGKVFVQSRLFFPNEVIAENWLISFENMFKQFLDFAFSAELSISGICISGNGPSLISVAGKSSKLLLWNTPLKETQTLKKVLGTKSIFLPRFETFSILFPYEFENAEFIFSGQEFLIYKLTGAGVTVLPEKRYVQAYWTEADLSALNIEKNKIPPFVEPGTLCGTYHSIPVFAGVPDFIAALIGTNTLSPGAACDRAGSSEGLNICVRTIPAQEKLQGLRLLPAPIAPFWNIAFILPNSGTLFYDLIKKSGGSFLDFESFMQSIAAVIKSANEGTAQKIDATARTGAALVKKIAGEVKSGMDLLEAASGFKPVYTMCGGQAKSPLWRKIKSEITKRNFRLLQIADAELLGNAAIAFTALKRYTSISEAAASITAYNFTAAEQHLKVSL